MDAVPVLVLDHLVDVLVIVGSQAERAELSFALIIDRFIIILGLTLGALRELGVRVRHPEVERRVEIRENDLRVGCQGLGSVRIQHVEVDTVIIEQLDVLRKLLLESSDVNVCAGVLTARHHLVIVNIELRCELLHVRLDSLDHSILVLQLFLSAFN